MKKTKLSKWELKSKEDRAKILPEKFNITSTTSQDVSYQKLTSDKGLLNGSCNRSACLAPNATFYNYSTRAHYCGNCARLINQANKADAMVLYGHDLCIERFIAVDSVQEI